MKRKMSILDDQLAKVLTDLGYSYRRAGEILGRDGATVKAGVMRTKRGKIRIPMPQMRELKRLYKFAEWLNYGKERGFLELLFAGWNIPRDRD